MINLIDYTSIMQRQNRNAVMRPVAVVALMPMLLLMLCTLTATAPCVDAAINRRPIGSAIGSAALWEPRTRRNAEHNLCDKLGCRCTGASMVQCNFTEVSLDFAFIADGPLHTVQLRRIGLSLSLCY